MGINYSPRIVTNGLVLCLDAASSLSYPGTGNTWYDLSGNGNNALLLDNMQYSANKYFILDGSSDGAEITNFPAIFNKSVTLSGWFYFDTNNTRDVIFGSYNSSMNINFERHLDNKLRLYWNNGANDIFSASGAAPPNIWLYISMIRNKELNQFQFYVNNSLFSYNNVSSADVTTSGLTFKIGRDTRTDFTNMGGRIATIKIYDKALSAHEVNQNYLATKGRFAL